MLKIAIVDDDKKSNERLKLLLLDLRLELKEEMDIRCFYDGMNFIEEYSADYDIVLMDIEMPLMNGIQAAKKLREKDPKVVLIFLTIMSQYAIYGYDVDAAGFFVKPVNETLLKVKITSVVEKLRRNRDLMYVFYRDNEYIRIPRRDIMYVESFNHYCVFHTANSEYRKLVSLKEVENELRGDGFLRSCNSYLINTIYIRGWSKDKVILEGNTVIPVSRTKRKAFYQELVNILGDEFG